MIGTVTLNRHRSIIGAAKYKWNTQGATVQHAEKRNVDFLQRIFAFAKSVAALFNVQSETPLSSSTNRFGLL